jgi:hypothetical protein
LIVSSNDDVHFPEPAKRYEVLLEPALDTDFIRSEAKLVFAEFVKQNTPQANTTAGSDDDEQFPHQLTPIPSDSSAQSSNNPQLCNVWSDNYHNEPF